MEPRREKLKTRSEAREEMVVKEKKKHPHWCRTFTRLHLLSLGKIAPHYPPMLSAHPSIPLRVEHQSSPPLYPPTTDGGGVEAPERFSVLLSELSAPPRTVFRTNQNPKLLRLD